MYDKQSLFEDLSIGETGLGGKKNLTAGYCGRNGGFNMTFSVRGGPGCGKRVPRAFDAKRAGNVENMIENTWPPAILGHQRPSPLSHPSTGK